MSKSPVFVNIQALRLVAAAMVVLHHIVHQIDSQRVPGIGDFNDYLGLDGSTGVDIFFVISGFIMVVTSSHRFGSPGQASIFIKRRLARIVPLYWLFTVLMIAASVLFRNSVAHTDIASSYIATSLFFIPMANAEGQIQPVLLLGWTLNYEMMFYAIFALAMVLPKRIGISAIFMTIVALAMLGIWVSTHAPAPIQFWTRPIIVEFLLGIIVGLLILRRPVLAAYTAVLLIVLGFTALWGASIGGLTDTVWRCLAAGLPAAMIVAGTALAPQLGQSPISRLLRLGGDASYALYLAHPFVINAMSILWRHVPVANSYAFIGATLMVAFAVSIAVHLLIERPILDAIHRRPIALMQHPIALFLKRKTK